MSKEEIIQVTLQKKFQAEKLKRVIEECDDINLLKEIAIELLNLNKQTSAIADWSIKKVLEAEKTKLV